MLRFVALSKLLCWLRCFKFPYIPIHKLVNDINNILVITCHWLNFTRKSNGYCLSVCTDTFQSLLLRRCWMSGDRCSVPLMSPCKEQSATLSSFYPRLCLQSCTTGGSSKKRVLVISYVWFRSQISLQPEDNLAS